MKIDIILGLGFGDEGKGKTVDYLCSDSPNSLVIRFSGGPQAGHTVIYNGVKHVFSSFGSGTLRGIPTYFTEDTCIYLNSLDTEREILIKESIIPVLTVHPLTKIITPFDVFYGRKRDEELKHGTVGLGVGACMKRSKEGYNLYAVDLMYPEMFREKVKNISEYYKTNLNPDVLDKFHGLAYKWYNLFGIKNYEIFRDYEHLVFEGSQGILLDMDHGMFPHVTYANTTSKNVFKLLEDEEVSTHYVTRCYQTRHGYGWMSNENNIKVINNQHEINTYNEYQKNFRIGELDYELLNQSLQIDAIYNNSSEYNLHITCLDQRPYFKFDSTKLRFEFKNIYSTGNAKNLYNWKSLV